jgi:UPF0755 protein
VLRLTVQSLKIISIITVAVLIVAGARVGFDYAVGRTTDDRTGEEVSFTVSADDNDETIAERLTDQELIRYGFLFTNQMRLAGAELQPGEYTLTYGMSNTEIIDEITVPEEESEGGADDTTDEADATADEDVTTSQVTVIENMRLEQIAQLWADAGLEGGAEAFIAATQEDFSDSFPFLAERPEGASLEGYLFPETYTLSSDMTPEDAVFQMLTVFDERFNEELRSRADQMGMTMHQVLTVASIVEREAAVAEERPTIAAVYLNRVEADMTLDADPTVQYVLGTPDEWWPTIEPNQQRSEQAQSPYNTYENPGLPPGPICNPSYDSIFAVLEPDPVDYLFFVARNDGSGTHVFASTFEEHQVNIDTYLNSGTGAQPTVEPEG